MHDLRQGRIAWIAVPDRNDVRKHRPVVILTRTDEIESTDELVCVVCSHSTALQDPLPDSCVLIPYQPQGRVRTRLRKPTVAVCDWIVGVDKYDLLSLPEDDLAGVVPASVLELIAERIIALRGGET